MMTQVKRLKALALPLVLPLALCLFLWQAVTPSSAEPTVYRFVAIMGNDGKVDQVAANFIAEGHLKYVREYGNASADYVAESPNYTGGTPPDPFNIKLFQVMTTTPNVNSVVADVYAAATAVGDVQVEKEIQHLAYLPKQLLLSGQCSDVAVVVSRAELTPVQGLETTTFQSASGCFAVGAYNAYAEKTVVESIDAVNMLIDRDPNINDALAQPNQFTMGFPSGDYIFGSPAGMATPGDITPTLPTSPFDGSTGEGIAIVLFDTSPYVNAPPVSAQFVNGLEITVDQSLPLPPQLPYSGQAVVGSHGTFVATPITEYAPNSDITLMRALSLDGIGTEFLLIQAIEKMRQQVQTNAESYKGIIFNYSLGLEEEGYVNSLSALARTLERVHATNIAQVAAAGNNSAWTFVPKDPNLPASHDDVIGVTGIAPGNRLACYANRGDIATWGGGDPRGPNPCLPDKIVHDCALGLRGGCLTGYDPHSPNSWAFGVGTSFASPIIAGMLAQRMETLAPSRSELWVNPTLARTELEQSATADDPNMGSGFIGDYSVPTSVSLTAAEQSGERQAWVVSLLLLLAFITAQSVRHRMRVR